jgi:hypothetical protein
MTVGLGVILLCIPVALWGIVVDRLRHSALATRIRWGHRMLLVGLFLFLAMPTTVAIVVSFSLIVGQVIEIAFLALTVAAWFGTLLALGIDGVIQHDDGTQLVALLVGAYGILGALLAYLAERGADLGTAFGLALAGTFIPALIALLLLATDLWTRRRALGALALIAISLLTIATLVLAGLALRPSSPFGQAMTDPQRYAGPAMWLAGCAARPQTIAPEGIEQKAAEPTQVAETVIAEQEAPEVGKDKELEVETPTAMPSLTATPAPTPSPTGATSPPSTAVASAPELPLPLLEQVNPETLLWLPEEVTDREGQLTLEIALPEPPATWRMTVLASTQDGDLGTGTATLDVSWP